MINMASESMSQAEALKQFRENGKEAETVGRYIRVKDYDRAYTCYGPSADSPATGWRVVEIDWERKAFLVAPKEDLDYE